MARRHSQTPNVCREEDIQELAELGDNESYMIFASTNGGGNKGRIKRGLDRMAGWIQKFELLKVQVGLFDLSGRNRAPIENFNRIYSTNQKIVF